MSASPARPGPLTRTALIAALGLLLVSCGRTEPVETADETTTTTRAAATSSPTTTTTEVPEQPSSYVIQPGDSLGGIASAYGLSTDELAEYNNLADVNRIAAGQQLLIPPGATSTTTTPTTAAPPPPETETTAAG